MAKLFYSPQLSLGFEEAFERQKNGAINGDDHHLGSHMIVTWALYEKVFKLVSEAENMKKVLGKITSQTIREIWEKKFPGVVVVFPIDNIKVVPCIKSIVDDVITVGLPFHIVGATGKQTEEVLSVFTKGTNFEAKLDEILVKLEVKVRASFDIAT